MKSKYESFFETLGAAIEESVQYLIDAKGMPANMDIDSGVKDGNPGAAMRTEIYFHILSPFNNGGLAYGTTKKAHYELESLKGKKTKKYFHVTIFRKENGRYEMTCYIL